MLYLAMTTQQVLTEGNATEILKLIGWYLAIVGGSAGIAWPATEGVGKMQWFANKKPGLGLFFGVVAALIFWQLGLLPDISTADAPVAGSETATLIANGMLAALCGLGGGGVARATHTKVIKPRLEKPGGLP